MTDTELIAKQAKRIAELEADKERCLPLLNKAIGKFYNIGQPLNDNILRLDTPQLKWAYDVVTLVTEARNIVE